MNGSLTYGTWGRLLSVVSYLSMLIVAMHLGGILEFLPPKVAAFILALGATLTTFSERAQGGASRPEIREAAAKSDQKNAIEEINEGD